MNEENEEYNNELIEEEVEEVVEDLERGSEIIEDDSMDIVEEDGEGMMELLDDSVQGFFMHGEGNGIYSIDIHPSHHEVAVSGGGDDSAYIWNISTGETIHALSEKHKDSVVAVGFSFDGKYVASAGMDGNIHVYISETGEKVCSLEGPDEIIFINWHPRGYVLVAGSHEGNVWMWSVPTGTVMQVFSGHTAPVLCGRFSENGKFLVTGSEDSSLILWNPKINERVWRLSGENRMWHQSGINVLDISHDNNLIVTGGTDGIIHLVSLETGKIISSFDAHKDTIESVCFDSAMNLVASASMDGAIHIWDLDNSRVRVSCIHDDGVTQVHFHKNSPLLTSACVDGSVSVWDSRTGERLNHFRGHQDAVLSIASSSDGKTVLSGGDDGMVLVFKRQ